MSSRNASAKSQPEWEPVVVRMSDVEPEQTRFLWPNRIPYGKVTLLEGDPGGGKTTLSLQIAANVTLGHPFPDEAGEPRDRRPPANVIYMTAEDGLADTIRPRLDAAGADPSRVFCLTGKQAVGEDGRVIEAGFTLADVEVLRRAVRDLRPDLVVIDPVQAYLGAAVDMHRANEVRPLLTALGNVAEEFVCAIVCIRHLRKSSSDRAIHRGLGSIDFAAQARSILLVGQDPENEHLRVLAHVKSSLAPACPSISFELGVTGFRWAGVSSITADMLLAPRQGQEDRNAEDEAASWLEEMLSDGPVPARDIKRAAGDAGLSWRTVERAKARLSVRSGRSSMGNTGAGAWLWELPVKAASRESSGGLAAVADVAAANALPATPPMQTVAVLPEPRGERQHPQGRNTATPDLLGKASALAVDIRFLDRTAASERAAAALSGLGVAPGWWQVKAKSEPHTVLLAAELIQADMTAGTLSPNAQHYLSAAKAALEGEVTA